MLEPLLHMGFCWFFGAPSMIYILHMSQDFRSFASILGLPHINQCWVHPPPVTVLLCIQILYNFSQPLLVLTVFHPQNFDRIHCLPISLEGNEHGDQCPFHRASYSWDMPETLHYMLPNIFKATLKISEWLLTSLGLQGFLKLAHKHHPS